MKRILTIIGLVLLGLVSNSCYDDSAIWESFNDLDQRLKTLETLCTEMNTNLSSLQSIVEAQKRGDYIVDVTPITENGIEIGYQITFNEHGTINIYHGKDGQNGTDGKDGMTPVISIAKDTDGIYYWTINGEWITDDKGNKLPVTGASGTDGVTPKLKIENQKWYVSYDEGKTWEEVGNAVAEDNDSHIFKDVKLTDGALTLTLADGTVITIPVGNQLRIILGDFDADSIQHGEPVEIPYYIEGAKSEISVFVLSDGWMFQTKIVEDSALSGKLIVSQEDTTDEEVTGKIAIFAVEEDGTTVSKVIRLKSGVLYPTSGNYHETYTVDGTASQIEFTVATNREFTVRTGADWITYVETKAVEEKTLIFDIKNNEGPRRSTFVEIASGYTTLGFKVVQKCYFDGFPVNITCNEAEGTWQWVEADTLYNKAGQKIYEALGYSSWEEFGAAGGDWEQAYLRLGEVKLLAYDINTGNAFTNYESYFFDFGFRHGEEGYLTNEDWLWKTSWNWNYGEYLLSSFSVSVNMTNMHVGETYSFGILLTSPYGEAPIEVTVNVAEYEDPEKGLYDNPAVPGRYEFTVCDTLDLNHMESEHNSFLCNTTIAETIKSTLGMTTLEIYNSHMETEFHLADGSRENGQNYISLDQNGYNSSYSESTVIQLTYQYGILPGTIATNIYVPAQWNNLYFFTPAVYDAIGKTIKYDYIIRHGEYQLIFTHEITITGEEPKTSWGLMGMIEGNEWGTDVPLEWDGEWYVAKDITFTQLAFKIRGNGDWSNDVANIGVIPGVEKSFINQRINVVTAWEAKNYYGSDAADIRINGELGTYDIYFSHEMMLVYVMEQGYRPGQRDPIYAEPEEISYTVVGTLNNANWNNNAPEGLMTHEGSYYVARNVHFVTAATLYQGADQIEFKIVETGTWDNLYGIAPGTGTVSIDTPIYLAKHGDNICLSAPEGCYDVYFKKSSNKVWVMTPGCMPEDSEQIIWENDGSAGVIAWDVTYRFGLEGTDLSNECLATLSYDVWERMKTTPFKVQISPTSSLFQIRITDAWWSIGMDGQYDIFQESPSVINNNDGTYTIKVDLQTYYDPPLTAIMDQQHLLFTGCDYIINKMYFE